MCLPAVTQGLLEKKGPLGPLRWRINRALFPLWPPANYILALAWFARRQAQFIWGRGPACASVSTTDVLAGGDEVEELASL